MTTEETIAALDRGELRVAEPSGDDWVVHEEVQAAILDFFRSPCAGDAQRLGPFEYHDKIPLKSGYEALGVRVVPPAVARYGSFLSRGVVLMPSYVTIGAWVGPNTMVDTWATVGSGAQIGAGVHLAGGVGIGGVLEPPGSSPVIVEDGAFIGSRCIITEGVRIGREAVLAPNVSLTASVPVIDVSGPEAVEYRGSVPARAVVVPGTRPRQFPAGTYQLSCALIIGYRNESTDLKTSLNAALRASSGVRLVALAKRTRRKTWWSSISSATQGFHHEEGPHPRGCRSPRRRDPSPPARATQPAWRRRDTVGHRQERRVRERRGEPLEAGRARHRHLALGEPELDDHVQPEPVCDRSRAGPVARSQQP